MRIAICDPDPIAAQKLKKAFYTYAESRRLDLLVESYPCGETLINSGIRYHLILIAFALPGLSGTETAKAVKRRYRHSAIMFTGKGRDLSLQALETHPLRILLQPIENPQLFSALDNFFTTAAVSRPLWLKNGCDTYCCTVGDIYYLEADNKYCRVSLRHKKVPCRQTMAHLSHALPPHCFQKISRSYIVNLTCIESYNKKTVRLTNGETLPVTKKYYNSFQSGFSAFCDPIIP